MNFRQLEIFLAILETGSFSAGAKVCLISQSTASQAIAALEEEIGVRLLERMHGGVNETPAGRVLKKHAKQILSDVASAYHSLERQKGVANTTLVVAASTIPCAYLVPPVLLKTIAALPELRITLLGGDSSETIERVRDRDADLGIVGSRFEERGLVYQPFHRDVIRLYAAAGHGFGGETTLEGLGELPLILREQGSGSAKAVNEALLEAGFDPVKLKARIRVGSTEAAKAAMLCGLGAAFLSELAVSREIERGDTVEIEVKGIKIARTFYLVRRQGAEPTGATLHFWDAMTRAGSDTFCRPPD